MEFHFNGPVTRTNTNLHETELILCDLPFLMIADVYFQQRVSRNTA
jgi:hypothetical protein